MEEALRNNPIRVITGPCQTSNRQEVEYIKSLSNMIVVNPGGETVQAIAGGRLCTVKSRTDLKPLDLERKGMGIDFAVWEEFSKKVMHAIKNRLALPEIPTSQGGQWAEEIQEDTDGIPLAFEAMDWMHAMLMMEHIIPGTGIGWSPSVLTLGESVEMLSETVGDYGGILGIKNPKFYPKILPRNLEDGPTTMENTWTGLAMYALGATQLPKEIMLIERGMDVPEKDNESWRNLPDHNSARLAKKLLQEKIANAGYTDKVKISVAYDPSHTNGPGRVGMIVNDTIQAAQLLDLNENPLYDVMLIESTDKNAPKPLSDAGQHIVREQVQEIVDGIAKFRPIKGYK